MSRLAQTVIPLRAGSDGPQALRLTWTIHVDGRPAALHQLAISHARIARDGVPALIAWRSAREMFPATAWTTEVRPRVLRAGHPDGQVLCVADNAAALEILERGADADEVIEHRVVVLAEHAARAWSLTRRDVETWRRALPARIAPADPLAVPA